MIDTNETLLDRIKSTDAHDAWKLFYESYWAAILAYARKLGLAQHQADEVLQETMVTLMRILPEFSYDRRKGKFRNFLLTIVHRRSLAAMRRARSEHDRVSTVDVVETQAEPSGEDIRSEAELRWRESIQEAVLRRLSREGLCDNQTMNIFNAYVLQGHPAVEVAQQFGVKVNAVYQIKNRLTRRLQMDAERLLRDSELG